MTGIDEALAYALTGVTPTFADGADAAVDPLTLVGVLEAQGWTAERLAEHARETLDAGEIWPHPVAPEVLAHVGAARFHAALTDVRQRLSLWTVDPRPPSHRTTLDADERRLLADAPPHHVG